MLFLNFLIIFHTKSMGVWLLKERQDDFHLFLLAAFKVCLVMASCLFRLMKLL